MRGALCGIWMNLNFNLVADGLLECFEHGNDHICILGQFFRLRFILKLCDTCMLYHIRNLTSPSRPPAVASLPRRHALLCQRGNFHLRRMDWVEVSCVSY